MAQVAKTRTETSIVDFKPAYTPNQARAEAHRCLFCSDAPCIQACPTSINIPQFIRKIATENLVASARTIFESNILGMSCARVCPVEVLCVGDCVYHGMDQPPIQIGKLQRFATDLVFDQADETEKPADRFFEAGSDSGKSVGLIGSGPASLAAAHELRIRGHACTLYEKRSVLGGLSTTGVAPYKMRADRAQAEVDWVLSIGGIEVETGIEIGRDKSFAELEAQHDAVFLGFGLGPDSQLQLPGSSLEGIHGAVAWIESMKLSSLPLGDLQRVVVIGGGNTAVDAVRECLQLGIPNVTMLYRGDASQMSGYTHEWRAAQLEGAHATWRVQPTAFVGDANRVTGVQCGHLDAQKQPVEGEALEVPADLVLLAIGQSKLGVQVHDLQGISVDHGRIVTDDAGATGRSGYFAGGDCRNGGKEVVNAVHEGKTAAIAIDSYLNSSSLRGAAHV